ncbi:hypothetical protein TNCV_4013331 [Trichonephila clavipes]|nr:hypothetical protein TNCV_4013331 [Trichonephila clavipes]
MGSLSVRSRFQWCDPVTKSRKRTKQVGNNRLDISLNRSEEIVQLEFRRFRIFSQNENTEFGKVFNF